jgi:hypothetical protein
MVFADQYRLASTMSGELLPEALEKSISLVTCVQPKRCDINKYRFDFQQAEFPEFLWRVSYDSNP